jgi:hypothetical protein
MAGTVAFVGGTAGTGSITNASAVNPLPVAPQASPTLRALKGIQDTTITSSTAETTIITADATHKLDLYGLILANKSATGTTVTIKDATSGTTRAVIYVPATDTRGFMLSFDSAIPQATANNNWTATSSASIDSLYVSAFYVQS